MHFLTKKEIAALQDSGLDRGTPFLIEDVQIGYFSIARHYGGVRYSNATYTYLPLTDELIRDDVLKWVKNYRKEKKIPVIQEGLF